MIVTHNTHNLKIWETWAILFCEILILKYLLHAIVKKWIIKFNLNMQP
jgi:hypothetical protein